MKFVETTLILKYLGINTSKEPVVYMREDCHICQSEGFRAQARIRLTLRNRSIVATLHSVKTEVLKHNEASLSDYAWELLNARDGDEVIISHPKSLDSLSYIRKKIEGDELTAEQTKKIIIDVVSGNLSDINIAMYIAASADDRLTPREVVDLTRAMVDTGKTLHWISSLVVDKHCIGGLPGNRTTPIVVAIVAEFGLMIPKTSSRSITSPAGTADTMEVFTKVDLDLKRMKKVVENENGCFVWGGAMALSPADDLLIRIERTANLDSEAQMVASILSKKIAAGSSHVVIDVPIGTTAKIPSIERAESLKRLLDLVAKEFGIMLKTVFSDGSQPVGRGIGPALEALDILAVLRCEKEAPQDLHAHALMLAGHIIEFSPNVEQGQGMLIATEILNSGRAYRKFEAICQAQGGGMRDIPIAPYSHTIESQQAGRIINIDNFYLSQLAKLAGAPEAKSAGVKLLTQLNAIVCHSEPLFTIHAETQGQLQYALSYLKEGHEIFQIAASS